MLSEIVKKHQAEQSVRRKESDIRRKEAMGAANTVTKVLVESLNERLNPDNSSESTQTSKTDP